MTKSNFVIKLILSLGLILILISLGIMMSMTPETKSKSSKLRNVELSVQNTEIGGDFILLSSKGEKVDSKKLRGKLLLIYFGFTNCPDICPASLIEMTNTIDELGENAKDVVPIFITIDPKRDTPETLDAYFKNFDPNILALTGNEKDIESIAAKFKVYYAKARDGSEDTSNYLINHSSFYYLIGKDGKLLKYYTAGAKGKEIAKNIRKLINS